MLTRWIWRLVRWAAAAALLLVVALVAQEVWTSSSDIRDEVLIPAPRPVATPVTVLEAEGELITLPRTPLTQTDGVWGIRWPGGYGQARQIMAVTEDTVARRFSGSLGMPPPGTAITFDPFAFRAEPDSIRGIPVEEVVIPGPLGEYPAYVTAGDGDLWVIALHDRSQDGRRQVARILPTLHAMDLPVLVATYRNDAGAPRDPDGYHRWGIAEWEEVEAMLRYAMSQGAERAVVYGWGMGGAIAATFVHETPRKEQVAGLILDSAILDLGAYADSFANTKGLQRYFDEAAKALAAFRFDIKWTALDQVKRADEFDVPILLLHGTADAVSPATEADQLAASRPDLVTYERFPNAGHDALWNTDPLRYERAVEAFLAGLLAEEDQ